MKKAGRLICMLMALLLVMTAFSGCGGTESSAPPESPASSAPESQAPESAAPESESPTGTAWAPERAVEMVVPFSAGGSSDLCARAVEAVWSKYCDQPLVVTNMPGGGGVTGAMYVAASEPVGYTIEISYGSGQDMTMPYLSEIEYDPFEMLDPICRVTVQGVMIVVPSDSEFNSINDIVEWSKTHDEPVTASVSTANGTVDLAFQAIKYHTGMDINIVPHDSGSTALVDLLSGSYMMGGGTPSEIISYVQSGQLKVIGAVSTERDGAMPDVPTLQEQGIDIAYYGSIKGVAVPKNTPQEIKDYYEQLFADICADEEFQQIMLDTAQASMYMDTDEFTEYFKEASESYKGIIENLGLAYYS